MIKLNSVATLARRAVAPIRLRYRSLTGVYERNERPKSPCSAPPNQLTYWTGSGSFRCSSSRLASTASRGGLWMPLASSNTTAGSPGVNAYRPKATSDTTNRTLSAPSKRCSRYPSMAGDAPFGQLSGERDLVVDDVQVVRMEREVLGLLAVRGDERHDQEVDIGHVCFDDLLRLYGQRLALGGVGLTAHAGQRRLELGVGVAAVIGRPALGQGLIKDVERIAGDEHVGRIHRRVEILTLGELIADVLDLFDL